MAIPSEVRKTVLAIDKKIKELESMKKALLEAFGGALVTAKANGNKPSGAISPKGAPLAVELSSGAKLAVYLQEHGPATRKEIYEYSGIPSGSVSYLLKSGRFKQRVDEKWEVAA